MGKSQEKRKYWTAVLYPENMVENWEDSIADLIQVPFAYCIHDKDIDSESNERKVHLHLLLAFSNTTTYNNAVNVLSVLNKDGFKSFNIVKPVFMIRSMYNYLIHDTESCKKQNKYLYPSSSRIEGNGFDIGLYEQVSLEDKKVILRQLADEIIKNGYTNFSDFYLFVVNTYADFVFFDVLTSYSGFLERLTKANYLKSRAMCKKEDLPDFI